MDAKYSSDDSEHLLANMCFLLSSNLNKSLTIIACAESNTDILVLCGWPARNQCVVAVVISKLSSPRTGDPRLGVTVCLNAWL